MSRIKVGVVGCGEISRVHLASLNNIEKCSVVAVCDLIEDRALQSASNFGIASTYTNFDSMLEKENLDVVYVLTNPQTHPFLSIKAMEAGCHVFVEKPMAVTLKEADEMVSASKKNDVKLCVSHSFIHTPPVLKARNLVKKGFLGELIEVNTVVSINPLMRQKHPQWIYDLPGGIFGEIIPHGLYTELAFLKSVDRVQCLSSGNYVKEGVPFNNISALLHSDVGLGRLLLSSNLKSPFTVIWLNLLGTEARLDITIPSGSIVKKTVNGNNGKSFRVRMNISPALQLIKGTIDASLKTLMGKMHSYISYETLSRMFIESVNGLSNPPVTPEEGREIVKVTEMIWKDLDIL